MAAGAACGCQTAGAEPVHTDAGVRVLLTEILPRAARLYPGVQAVRCGAHTFDYRTMAERVARLAVGLRRLGVERGDRVAILHRNCHRVLETYFAAVHAGAVLVPLNLRLTADDLAHIVDDTASRVLIVDDGWAGLGAAVADRTRTPVILVASRVEGAEVPGIYGYDYERWLASSDPAALARGRATEDDAVHIYYTSGTTGHHKGVVLSHRNVANHALATVAELGLGDRDVWAHVAPMFHLADAWAVWALTWAGGHHVMVGRCDPEQVLRVFVEHGVTITNLIPTMLNDLVGCPAAASTELPDFRLVMSGGAPIAPRLVQRVVDLFQCEYVQTYGLTETSPYLTFSLLTERHRTLPLQEQLHIRSLTGRPARGVEVRVVDEQGCDVVADGCHVGEIVARGDRAFGGYWQQPQATAEAFDERGFFHTGDLATVDGEGYLNIVDRKK